MKLLKFSSTCLYFLVLIFISCEYPQKKEDTPESQAVHQFLTRYTTDYQRIEAEQTQALLEQALGRADSSKLVNTTRALHVFLGNTNQLQRAVNYLKDVSKLTAIQVKQLQRIVYDGTMHQQSLKNTLAKKAGAIATLTKPAELTPLRIRNRYYGIEDFDSLFLSESNERTKRWLWENNRRKTIGKSQQLYDLVQLNNEIVSAAGYGNYFEYKAGAYQFTTQELLNYQQTLLNNLRPLMAELHTYLRYKLAAKYKQAVPNRLPIHWLPDFAGLAWQSTIDDPLSHLNDSLVSKRISWIQETAESYFRQQDYPAISARSFQYAKGADGRLKAFYPARKEVAISVDLVNTKESYLAFSQVLAQVNYRQAFTNLDVPFLLREPISNSFDIAFQLHQKRVQQNYLMETLVTDTTFDKLSQEETLLLYEALYFIPRLVYHIGVIQQFEFSLYANGLDLGQFNYKWWELYERFMGISLNADISTEFCDPFLTDLHQNMDISSADQVIGIPLAFQLKELIAENSETQSEYRYLQSFLYTGASYEFQRYFREFFGEELSTTAIRDHFEPVYQKLRKINSGRRNTLPKWD